ncbi:MAG: SBBP repeat-containing protein, partial [Bacteroidota bacterium]
MKVSLRSKRRVQKLGLTLLTAFVFSLLTVKSFAGDSDPSSLLNQGKRFLLVENKGQVIDQSGRSRSDVKFIGKADGVKAVVLSNGISYQFEKHPEIKKKSNPKSISGREEISADDDIETYRLDVRLVGSNPSPTIRKEEKTDYFENYYNVPGYPEGIQGVSAFEKVIMENVYPGIDWAIYIRDGKLKYDFIVKPGADPSKIVLEYQGAEKLALQNDGSILATSPMGEVEEAKPVCFSGREEVASAFVLNGNRISFAVNAYDKSQPLVIDPALLWATYYGGTDYDYAYSTTTDFFGNVYLAGFAKSSGLATSGAHQTTLSGTLGDAFLAKYDNAGVMQWATYYGGTNLEIGYSVAVTDAGDVYLTGFTNSTAGIASTGAYDVTYGGAGLRDAFLAKFNSSGARQWGTYYGGAGNDEGYSLGLASDGSVYLAGTTSSTADIATTGTYNGGTSDAFLVKFTSAGTRTWGIYYGGAGADEYNGMSIDRVDNNNVYLSGCTNSTSGIAMGGSPWQPTLGGGTDAFVAKFDPTGTNMWGTYFGGTGDDCGFATAIDKAGDIYMVGRTASNTGISTTNARAGLEDGFIAKFVNTGNRTWGRYFGGPAKDEGYFVAVDGTNGVYVSGYTESSTGINSSGITGFTAYSGAGDAMAAKFDNTGTPVWSTYYGGTGADYGYGIAVDGKGDVYLAGQLASSITMTGGADNTYGGGGGDAFLSKVDESSCPIFTAAPANVTVTSESTCTSCMLSGGVITAPTGTPCPYGSTLQYAVSTDGGTTYGTWTSTAPTYDQTNAISVKTRCNCDFDNTLSSSESTPVATVPGVCTPPTPSVSAAEGSGNAPNDGIICSGDQVTLNASGGVSYAWDNGSAGPSIMVSPTATTTYTVTATAANGCTATATSTVTVNPLPTPMITVNEMSGNTPNDGSICSGASFTLTASTSPASYVWNTTPNQTTQTTTALTPTVTTTYSVTVTDPNSCASSTSTTVTVNALPTPSIVVTETSGSTNNDGTICTGASATLTASGGTSYSWNTGEAVAAITKSPITTTSYTVTVTNADGCTATSSSTITVKALPTASISVAETSGSTNNDGTICTGASATLTASGGGTYKWSTTPEQTTPAITVSPIADATYTVTVTNADGCTSTTSTTITVKALPTASISVAETSGSTNNDGTICTGASATLTASGGGTYKWSTTPQQTTAAITVSPIVNTTYTVTVTNADGCTATSSSTITVKALPTPSIAVTDMSGNTNNDGTICSGASATMTASGGTGYAWSSGESVAAITKSP